ncbi:FAD-binding oxidoreductase [Consotaella salsifontis]|uniref:FAD/FMN-containing dehydrogenase n=1 Tax=Consotaella salsifontis TaxID=1365950 RepID=A0A1T4L9F7_9HYPH|nr:FAD-binding oxidoreductase [Consotaella salsifontis]SJZ51233.1 FAD/FMN-containing dehydrogenase [Consotaella salsifontis]
MRNDSYQSWGRLDRGLAAARRVGPMPFDGAGSGGVLPFGNGRTYGDSCQNRRGTLLDCRDANRILSFDAASGVVVAEAGALLCDITRLVAPSGWFLPVTPGTQFVTLGGAIANDVHGKNHHRRGTFGRWVLSMEMERSDRGRFVAAPDQNADLFAATIGGMGLTGLIRSAEIQLLAVPSMTIDQTTLRFDRLADYFEAAEEADDGHEYSVAWIDSLASGRRLGRGHLIMGDHAEGGDRSGRAHRPLASVPFTPPFSPLSGLSLKAFNEAFFRKVPKGTSRRPSRFEPFFYPLDRVERWNRLYGPGGMHQHQSVVPADVAPEAVRALIECAQLHDHGSFLTVLKRFGSLASPGLFSFPRPGYTLTLDFPHRGEATLKLLAELDRLVVAAGGALNPYKDAHMSPLTFAASYPDWARLESFRDPAIISDFWRRTAMTLPRSDPMPIAAE